MRELSYRLLACGWLLLALAATAHAQTWPTKPIRMIVSFPAGGPSDLLGRALTQKLGEQLGQNIIARQAAPARAATWA